MPIFEADPWREQYFREVACPPQVNIPTDDPDAWRWNSRHRWVYDKLRVALSQGIACGPHGVEPTHYPVFSKPAYNLRGMGLGSRALANAAEYAQHLTPGHMWMTLLRGEHWSTDAAVVAGQVRWMRSAQGLASGGGTFDYWVLPGSLSAGAAAAEAYGARWIAQHLPDYTGMVNLETIGGQIIEVHLRFTDQWPDLYGEGWLDALVRLYAHGEWSDSVNRPPRTGYSVVLFGAHDRRYRAPPEWLIEEISRGAEVSSVQITFHEDRPAGEHAMPPGGFRLAIINGWDLEAAKRARARLAARFEQSL
jgi:hypothetical protein